MLMYSHCFAWLACSILLSRLPGHWAELAHQEGLSDQKNKKGTFVRDEKLSEKHPSKSVM